MSVICITEEKMQEMTGGLLYHIEIFRESLVSSESFKKINDRVKGYDESEIFEENFIYWLMFRMWVANRVAYAVQYGVKVNLKVDLSEVTPKEMNLCVLSSELNNLNNNIYTNEDQGKIKNEWYNLFMLINRCIEEKSKISVSECKINNQELLFEDKNIIFSYSRAEAIKDGVLIDVTETALEMGIIFPVALTMSLWNSLINPSEKLISFGQSVEGRLWDTLWMFKNSARNFKGDLFYFEVYFLLNNKKEKLVKLKAVCSPGDTSEPVITIMLPNED